MAIRSFLYAPGHDPERIKDAFRYGADAVVFDLEDGVPADRKEEARANVVEALGRRAAWVRVGNEADLEAVAGLAAGIRLPKVRSADDARLVCERTSAPVICAIESGEGLEAAAAIAAVPGVLTLSLGGRDLTTDLGIADTLEALRPVREQLVAACSSSGRLGPVDSVYRGDDAAGLRTAAESPGAWASPASRRCGPTRSPRSTSPSPRRVGEMLLARPRSARPGDAALFRQPDCYELPAREASWSARRWAASIFAAVAASWDQIGHE